MLQRYLIRQEDVEPLAEGVLIVLEKVGMLYQNEEILHSLESIGARVDRENQIATFPRRLVEEFVEKLRKEAENGDEEDNVGFQPIPLPTLELQVAQFYYDYGKDEKRRGNKRDFIELIKLGDVLHPEEGVGHCLILQDVPPPIEPLIAGLILAEYAHKPMATYYTDVRQRDYLLEMDEILGGEGSIRPVSGICFAHPLRFDKDVADRFVCEVRKTGVGWLIPMPVAGISHPVTLEGFIVLASAAIIGGWLAARALNPTSRLGSSMWAGTSDMRGGVSFSSFDAMLYSFAVSEFMRKWCGMRIPVGGGEYCDAKKPGLYAVLEKAYKAMTIYAFQGHHPPIGQGMLECGKTISPVQLLLEREFSLGVNFFSRRVNPIKETIALEEILEVGIGFKKSHLDTMHTLKHFRSSLWLPHILERSGWNGFQMEKRILEKAQNKVEELVNNYQKPEGREEKLAKMREIVSKAEKDLLN